MNHINVMQQALEALEWASDLIDPQTDQSCECLVCKAIEVLQAALEQPEEPVAMRYDYDGYGYQYVDSGSGSDWRTRHRGAEPLYTNPISKGFP